MLTSVVYAILLCMAFVNYPTMEQAKMASYDRYEPGEKAWCSGQYEITEPRGGGTGIERTVTKGKPLPPTQQRGQGYMRRGDEARWLPDCNHRRWIKVYEGHSPFPRSPAARTRPLSPGVRLLPPWKPRRGS